MHKPWSLTVALVSAIAGTILLSPPASAKGHEKNTYLFCNGKQDGAKYYRFAKIADDPSIKAFMQAVPGGCASLPHYSKSEPTKGHEI
jgi:hypothetical protein